MNRYFEANKKLWNQRVEPHQRSGFYNLDAFKAGKSSLNPLELKEVGNVRHKKLLHLQCHFGMDTISWAQKGARATGVDFSENAIDRARTLNREMQADATFVCSDIYSLKEHLDEQFDIVFTSYGTINWLPDLQRWAEIVSEFLRPGGTFYIADFHPVIWMLDDELQTFKYSYFTTPAPYEEVSENSYAGGNKENLKEYFWNHHLGNIITSLTDKGLHINFLHEFPFSPYNTFPGMKQREDGHWYIDQFNQTIPLLYSIKATKP